MQLLLNQAMYSTIASPSWLRVLQTILGYLLLSVCPLACSAGLDAEDQSSAVAVSMYPSSFQTFRRRGAPGGPAM